MGYAYALSPGKERDSALSSIKNGYKEYTETMKKIEHEFEASIGSILIEMKGIQGFARICPKDVFEITIKYGSDQKWKSRGKILKDGVNQLWEHQSVMFKALLEEVISIKGMEVKGLGKKILLGNKLCETKNLFSPHPQLLTINLNNIGSLKLNLIVTWNPLHGVIADAGGNLTSQRILSKSSTSLIGSMRSLPGLFSGGSLSTRNLRSGTLPAHHRSTTLLFSGNSPSMITNPFDQSFLEPLAVGTPTTENTVSRMKKSHSAMAGISIKSTNTDHSTSSGSTSSSIHFTGGSSGFGSGSSYCSGSVPGSALTSPDTESAPIFASNGAVIYPRPHHLHHHQQQQRQSSSQHQLNLLNHQLHPNNQYTLSQQLQQQANAFHRHSMHLEPSNYAMNSKTNGNVMYSRPKQDQDLQSAVESALQSFNFLNTVSDSESSNSTPEHFSNKFKNQKVTKSPSRRLIEGCNGKGLSSRSKSTEALNNDPLNQIQLRNKNVQNNSKTSLKSRSTICLDRNGNEEDELELEEEVTSFMSETPRRKSYCSGSASVPASTLTSPETESFPINASFHPRLQHEYQQQPSLLLSHQLHPNYMPEKQSKSFHRHSMHLPPSSTFAMNNYKNVNENDNVYAQPRQNQSKFWSVSNLNRTDSALFNKKPRHIMDNNYAQPVVINLGGGNWNEVPSQQNTLSSISSLSSSSSTLTNSAGTNHHYYYMKNNSINNGNGNHSRRQSYLDGQAHSRSFHDDSILEVEDENTDCSSDFSGSPDKGSSLSRSWKKLPVFLTPAKCGRRQ